MIELKRKVAIVAVVLIVLLTGLFSWITIVGSQPKSNLPPIQPVQIPVSTSVSDGWMITRIQVSANNVTGGYDTHPNIYGHLSIVDSYGTIIVDSDWSSTNDWFGSYNQHFANFSNPWLINDPIAFAFGRFSFGNTTRLLAPDENATFIVQSGSFRNVESVHIPQESQYTWCGNSTSNFNGFPTSTVMVMTSNFTVIITLMATGHCSRS